MTRITVHYLGEHIVGFTAKGHTGYAGHGEDIVCAAVSALTQTAYLGIREYVDPSVEAEIKDGELRLMLPDGLDKAEMERAELILGTMLSGLRSIEDNYKDYLKISKREVKA